MTLLQTFRNDPFFSDIDLPRALSLEYGSQFDDHTKQVSQRRSYDDQTLDLFNHPFQYMENMMSNMNQMMHDMESKINSLELNGNNGQGLAFTSSTVMSIDNRNGVDPRIVQATSEKLSGPEGM